VHGGDADLGITGGDGGIDPPDVFDDDAHAKSPFNYNGLCNSHPNPRLPSQPSR
jgi:hypothetical protein